MGGAQAGLSRREGRRHDVSAEVREVVVYATPF